MLTRIALAFALVATLLVGLTSFSPVRAQDVGCIPGYDPKSYTWSDLDGNPDTADPGASPCSVVATVELLDLFSPDGGAVELTLTALNGKPGNPTPIGWVIGTSGTEEVGTRFGAHHLPAGVTVDFDPRSTVLGGEYQFVDFQEDWRRALLTTDGSFEGLKATVYWTPVDWGGKTPQSGTQTAPADETTNAGASEGNVTVGGDENAVSTCDKTAVETAVPGTWNEVADGGFQGTANADFTIPEHWAVNTANGLMSTGTIPAGELVTVYPCAS